MLFNDTKYQKAFKSLPILCCITQKLSLPYLVSFTMSVSNQQPSVNAVYVAYAQKLSYLVPFNMAASKWSNSLPNRCSMRQYWKKSAMTMLLTIPSTKYPLMVFLKHMETRFLKQYCHQTIKSNKVICLQSQYQQKSEALRKYSVNEHQPVVYYVASAQKLSLPYLVSFNMSASKCNNNLSSRSIGRKSGLLLFLPFQVPSTLFLATI